MKSFIRRNGDGYLNINKILTLVLLVIILKVLNASDNNYMLTTISGTDTCGDGYMGNTTCVNNPMGLHFTSDGTMYIAEFVSKRIRKVAKNGIVSTFMKTPYEPNYIFVLEKNIYTPPVVYLVMNNHVVKVLNDGSLEIVAGSETGKGDSIDGDSALGPVLNTPDSIYVTQTEDIYICDTNNGKIKKVSNGKIYTIAGNGKVVNTGTLATQNFLAMPQGVYVDEKKNEVYIADTNSYLIRKIDSSGVISTLAGISGKLGDDSNVLATSAKLFSPRRVKLNSQGEVFWIDSSNEKVKKIDNNGYLRVVAGNGGQSYNGDNIQALTASFILPQDVFITKDDQYVFVGDSGQLRVRRINVATQIIDTYAGNGYTSSSGDGIRAIDATYGQYIYPFINTKSSATNQDIYIGDAQGGLLRRIYYSIGDRQLYTNFLSFVGGASMVNNPRGLYVDDLGNIYYAVVFYCNVYKMEKTTGQQILMAGMGHVGSTGSGGPATSAMLNRPVQVFGNYGNLLYIVENGSSRIRVIDLQSGILTEFCGTSVGYGGDNDLAQNAQIANPGGAFYHRPTGDIYIADTGNGRIRKISANDSIITTVAGNGIYTPPPPHPTRFSQNALVVDVQDGILAINATLIAPTSVVVNDEGEIFIAEKGSFRIRKVLLNGTIITIAGNGLSENPSMNNQLGTDMPLIGPETLTINSDGDLFVADNIYLRKLALPKTPSCFGISSTNSSVCSGHGQCYDFDSCECYHGYRGINCEKIICFDVSSDDPYVCGGHGQCIDVDTCKCFNDTMYTGPECKVPICFGKNASDTQVCSGNGTCVDYNKCQCFSNKYSGLDCSVPYTCYNISFTDPKVCSGNGQCQLNGTCTCQPTFVGPLCDLKGIRSDDIIFRWNVSTANLREPVRLEAIFSENYFTQPQSSKNVMSFIKISYYQNVELYRSVSMQNRVIYHEMSFGDAIQVIARMIVYDDKANVILLQPAVWREAKLDVIIQRQASPPSSNDLAYLAFLSLIPLLALIILIIAIIIVIVRKVSHKKTIGKPTSIEMH